MKKIICYLILLGLSSNAYSIGDQSISCSVNGHSTRTITCEDGWVEMKGYPEVEIKLANCIGFWDAESIEVRIDSKEVESYGYSRILEKNLSNYSIECREN